MAEVPYKKPFRVWIEGCFDLVHFGHANAIRQAKKLGGELVAGVISDEEIEKYKRPPVYTEEERTRLIRAIKWVDEVVPGIPYNTTFEMLDQYSCDVIAHGDDVILDENGKNYYDIFKEVGRFRMFKRTEGISTTDIVSRILDRIKHMDEYHPICDSVPHSAPHNGPLISMVKVFEDEDANGTDSPNDVGHGYSVNGVQTQTGEAAFHPNDALQRHSTVSSCFTKSPMFMGFSMDKYFAEGLRGPKADDIVVYVPGVYDLFHIGHICFFEKCLEIGNYLLVGLYSDENATKEASRLGSIMTMQERLLSLLSCRYVKNVIIDAPLVVSAELLDTFRVNFVVLGEHNTNRYCENDLYKIPKQRGIFRTLNSGSSVTTSSVISRLLANRLLYQERNSAKIATDALAQTSA